VSEFGDKVSADDKGKVEVLIKDLRAEIGNEEDKKPIEDIDFDLVKTLTTDLQQTLYTIGASLYQQASGTETDPNAGAGVDSPPPGADDDVIDADFTESK
jgi:molecular chaperone DnaK